MSARCCDSHLRHLHSGDRGRRIAESLKPAWGDYVVSSQDATVGGSGVQGQPVLCIDALSAKTNVDVSYMFLLAKSFFKMPQDWPHGGGGGGGQL